FIRFFVVERVIPQFPNIFVPKAELSFELLRECSACRQQVTINRDRIVPTYRAYPLRQSVAQMKFRRGRGDRLKGVWACTELQCIAHSWPVFAAFGQGLRKRPRVRTGLRPSGFGQRVPVADKSCAPDHMEPHVLVVPLSGSESAEVCWSIKRLKDFRRQFQLVIE